MVRRYLKGYQLIALGVLNLLIGSTALAVDTDVDGVSNAVDNCLLVANADQYDSDYDGYGSSCDADYNNDLVVNFQDLVLVSSVFLQSEPFDDDIAYHVDMNNDGTVNFLDFFLFQGAFLGPPGPSAIDNMFDHSAAARFLTQTTFGPKSQEIDALVQSGDPAAWLENQFTIAASSHEILTRTYALSMCLDLPEFTELDGYYSPAREAAWWTASIYGTDQLRQRVAFALSQIFVAGDRSDQLGGSQYAMANYYDMLAEHAFGNFRDLMGDVTLHPVMGIFLSMVRNEKPQPALNIRPDENYARELMQLFTMGVYQLNLDGTPVLDGFGVPIPAYDQDDIEQFARVFTGWSYQGIDWYEWYAESDRTLPMVAFEEWHDVDEKELLGGVQLPAGQTAAQDLNAALDNLFSHPNVGPFISRLLIQRLVTSNPTPGYVQRVAQVFNDDGGGTRGDMKAILRAILLDPEARQGHVYLQSFYGKLREPLLRVTQMRRAFDVMPVIGSDHIWHETSCGQGDYAYFPSPHGSTSQSLGQQAQNSPSVFNFYQPDYAPPGTVRDVGLVAPEFQLFVASTAQTTGKVIAFEVQNNQIWGPGWVELDLSDEIALAAQPELLLDYLDVLLLNGRMSSELRSDLLAHMNDQSMPTDGTRDEVRARDTIMLILMSPEYLIQR